MEQEHLSLIWKYFDELGLKNEELLEAIMDFPEEIVLGLFRI